MTITTGDELVSALGNNSTRLLWDKASLSNAAAGQTHSLWRATGQPAQGAIPGAAAVCSSALLGSFAFNNQTAPATSYLAWATANCSNANVAIEIHDRLMHMGGLNGTLATLQTVNLDLNANLGTSNLDARKGNANFSDVSWWLEWYTDTGGTAVTATVAVTYNDGTSGNLGAISLAATTRASRMIQLNSFVPAGATPKYIRDVDSVTLSATTGAAGSFGVTATRQRATLTLPLASLPPIPPMDWASLGLPEVYNDSCLMLLQVAGTTNTGTVRGQAKLAHG